MDGEGLIFYVDDCTNPTIAFVKDLINRQRISGLVKIERNIVRDVPWRQ